MNGLQMAGTVERGAFCLDAAFTAAAGEVLGLLGPNGAGKTTLLRALSGLTALTSGHITLNGQHLDDTVTGAFLSPEQRPVGMVFQNYRLFPHLSVRDNIAFGPRSSGRGRAASRQLADGWADRLGVGELTTRKPAQLSGGQAQRVALARALAAEPGLLLLDEPLAALDARTRLEVRAELRRHLSEFAGPTVLVTHDPLEAMVMTDRLLVIEDGQIVQRGTPSGVARRPATQYVARLVGLNLYAGTPDRDIVRLDDGGTVISAAAQQNAGRRVLVAIAPTAIALHTTKPEHASPRNVWPGTVVGMELLTDRVRVEIHGSPSALVDITPGAVHELDLAAGTEVWLSAKATEIDIYPNPAPINSSAAG